MVTEAYPSWTLSKWPRWLGHLPCRLSLSASQGVRTGGDEMKRLGIALLLVLAALRGAGAAWAFNDDPPLTGPDSIQAP